jgi:hypothetical protein
VDIDKSALIAGPVYDKDGNLANGEPPLPGDTLLWGNNYGLCPDFRPITWNGRQLTLAEYSRVKGTASMKRVENGTHVVIHLSGLVPTRCIPFSFSHMGRPVSHQTSPPGLAKVLSVHPARTASWLPPPGTRNSR